MDMYITLPSYMKMDESLLMMDQSRNRMQKDWAKKIATD